MKPEPVYKHDDEGRFEIVNYNWSKPLSSFLPGIAGTWGVPSWCYFVNRNQLISGLGVQDKDGAILEFVSFNQALNLVGQTGFRTFIRKENTIYEPFIKTEAGLIKQTLRISPHELEIEDLNQALGLETRVQYFPLVELPTAGLVRIVEIKNLASETCRLDVIDGVARLIPYGTTFEHQKVTARHIEALMQASMHEGVPVFKLKQTAADEAQVGKIAGGHFLISRGNSGNLESSGTIIDPVQVFGGMDQYSTPWAFHSRGLGELGAQDQMLINQTPCAFSTWQTRLEPGEQVSFFIILGHAKTTAHLDRFVTLVDQPGFLNDQRLANQRVIRTIRDKASTVSSNPLFDAYCEYTFLDNVIRGGKPMRLGTDPRAPIIQVYGRQNADLERDYHWLELEPTYLSQGNGHYRSVLQNRRMDPWFFPWSGDRVIKQFINLIQLDGFNPLDVKVQRYKGLDPEKILLLIERLAPGFDIEGPVGSMVKKGFTPGELALELDEMVQLDKDQLAELLAQILSACQELEIGGVHVGYWVDHWLYNFDSIEVFLSLFPDRLIDILIGDPTHTFFDNPDIVLPRSQKTFDVDGKVRRYAAVRRDAEKERAIADRVEDPNKVRDRKGKIYRATLLVKLLCMVATKAAALDPLGLGVEMEADKPGWNDSLNGLPGMFGSSLCQSLVLIRALRFLLSSLDVLAESGINEIVVYVELAEFLTDLTKANQQSLNQSTEAARHRWWDDRVTLLEAYRDKTRLGVDGNEVSLPVATLRQYLKGTLGLVEEAFAQNTLAVHENGVPASYLRYEAGEYQTLGKKDRNGWTSVKIQRFEPRSVAMFLEGAVHYMRTFPEQAEQVYKSVRASELYDQELLMFRVCESLEGEPPELGRITAYPTGWLEHASIYTHMSFKWLLELLRAGLYDAFFDTLKTCLPPYMEPEVYGRSLLENSSFIVSSLYQDQSKHGQAFQPRLSGVTAEWLQIWTMMVAGQQPFKLSDSNELILSLEPVLPDWIFTKKTTIQRFGDDEQFELPENCFACLLFGSTKLIYQNPSRRSTYGADNVKVTSAIVHYKDGREVHVDAGFFEGEFARDVREGLIESIHATLG